MKISKKALFIQGGWPGHYPEKIVQIFAEELAKHDFKVQVESSLDCLTDLGELQKLSLIFPCWTMGQLSEAQSKGLQEAVRSGVGLAGIHGGMGDAFRGNLDYEWMTGGHFVGHPHVGDYSVQVLDKEHPITKGVPETFPYRSEQYYMMIDPGVHVLADTEYVYEGRPCRMPISWTKLWGQGRVFYSALGHAPEEFTEFPVARTLTIQGMLWAAR